MYHSQMMLGSTQKTPKNLQLIREFSSFYVYEKINIQEAIAFIYKNQKKILNCNSS